MEAKEGMQDCSEAEADWKKLEDMAAIFANPEQVAIKAGENLIINGREINHEIDTAVSDYKTEMWQDFGEQIGMAGAQVLLGEHSQTLLAMQANKKLVMSPIDGSTVLVSDVEPPFELTQQSAFEFLDGLTQGLVMGRLNPYDFPEKCLPRLKHEFPVFYGSIKMMEDASDGIHADEISDV